jgi:hypothetical protein
MKSIVTVFHRVSINIDAKGKAGLTGRWRAGAVLSNRLVWELNPTRIMGIPEILSYKRRNGG